MKRPPLRRPGAWLVFVTIVSGLLAQRMSIDPSFNPVVESVTAIPGGRAFVITPDQRLLTFGFSGALTANGIEIPHGVAVLEQDGSHDASFKAELLPDEIVQSAGVLTDGRVVVFAQVLGQTSGRVVRLLASGGIDPTFSPASISLPSSSAAANLTVLSDDTVVAWGGVMAVGSDPEVSRNGFAHFLRDGTLDTHLAPRWGTEPAEVTSLVATSDGGIVVTGLVYEPGFGTRNHFVRFTRAGAIDPTFIPAQTNGALRIAACLPDGRLLVANTRLYRFNVDGSIDPTFSTDTGLQVGSTGILALPDNRVVVEKGSALILKADGTLERDCGTLPDAQKMQKLAGVLADGRIIIIQGKPTWTDAGVGVVGPQIIMSEPTLCVVDPGPGTLTVLSSGLQSQVPGQISGLNLDQDGRVLATGIFTHIDGQPRANYARFLPNGTLDPNFAPVVATIPRFVFPDGHLIGITRLELRTFDGFHGYATSLVQLNPDGTLNEGFSPSLGLGLQEAVWLAVGPDGRALVCTHVGNGLLTESKVRLVWLNKNGSLAETLSTSFAGFQDGSLRRSAVTAAEVLADGKLLLSVAAKIVNGQPAAHVVRLNADGSTDTTYQPSMTVLDEVDGARPLPDGRAYLLGLHDDLRNKNYNAVLRLNADGSPDTFLDMAFGWGRVLADGSYVHGTNRYRADGTRDLNFDLPDTYRWGAPTAAVLARDGAIWLSESTSDSLGRTRYAFFRMVPTETAGFTVQPQHARTYAGLDVNFQAEFGMASATFQWTLNGTPIPGATERKLHVKYPAAAAAGEYRLTATVDGRTYSSEPAVLTVEPNTTRLMNFSARSAVSPEFPPQIGGFVLRQPRSVLLRAVGRGLPIENPGFTLLASPSLTLHRGAPVLSRDAGGALAPAIVAAGQRVGAAPLRPILGADEPTRDSALLLQLAPGVYTAQTASGDGRSGVSLFEFYDADTDASPATANVSIRGRAATGDGVLIAGFVVAGSGRLRLLIRGIGPGLEPFGVADVASDPRITLFNGSTVLTANDNWADQVDLNTLIDAAHRSGAFALPRDSRDAALFVSLEPGVYTVHGAANGMSGEMMIELYAVTN